MENPNYKNEKNDRKYLKTIFRTNRIETQKNEKSDRRTFLKNRLSCLQIIWIGFKKKGNGENKTG